MAKTTSKQKAAKTTAARRKAAKPKAATSQAAKSQAAKARTRQGPPPRQTPSSRPGVVVAVAAAAVALVLAAVWYVSGQPADDKGAETGGGATIEHVHGLGINPANGDLYAAAHNGLFRIPDGGKARRVGKGAQDTMGFTIAGSDHFLASGHPGHGEDGPSALGLMESTDGGATWRTSSLAGEADFHALRFRHDTVYGYNSMSGQLMVSADQKTWQSRGQVTLRDFAVSPSDGDTLVASGEQGLMRSTDSGRTWSKDGPPVMLLDWQTDDRLWAIGVSGEVKRSEDGGRNWSNVGTVDGQITAFAVPEKAFYVATADSAILQSADDGKTWTTIYS
ncbi:MAG: hypothetical protein GEU94_13305 [Micromonosporaceae bacterium]|nr:hypothetical protein [Micromonosporaceae bacterium]